MDDDWESAVDNEVVLRPVPTDVNKWAGEDDDDDVKESWEDEEEKKDEEKPETKSTPSKKVTKASKSKLAAQERIADEEEEKRLANMTSEEKLAEKLRLEKIQKESDLKTALETFGVSSENCDALSSFQPETKDEFKEFSSALSWKVNQFKDSPHFTTFIEDLVRGVCASMPSADLKKVKICVETLHSEKLKLEKQSKKPVGKGKARATIRTESNDIEVYQSYGNDFDDDNYDDFM